MGKRLILEPQITVTGNNLAADIEETKPLDEFVDVSDWDVAFITLHTLTITKADASDTVSISVGTTDSPSKEGLGEPPDGPAGRCVTFDDVGSNEWHKAYIGAGNEPQGTGTYPIENLMGWHIMVPKNATTGGAVSVTFEIFVTLKRAR